jgi:hypothetical protein
VRGSAPGVRTQAAGPASYARNFKRWLEAQDGLRHESVVQQAAAADHDKAKLTSRIRCASSASQAATSISISRFALPAGEAGERGAARRGQAESVSLSLAGAGRRL